MHKSSEKLYAEVLRGNAGRRVRREENEVHWLQVERCIMGRELSFVRTVHDLL